MTGLFTTRIVRRVGHEQTQPIRGRLHQAATESVDPSHRPVDPLRPGTQMTQVNTPLRLVLRLEEHLPVTCTEADTIHSLPLTFPLPLSWHRASITGSTPPRQVH